MVAYAFSLPPTPFIRQMNRSTSGEDQERGLEEGLEPLKLWWKEIADQVIQDELGHSDLEWAWNDEVEVDRVQQNEMDDKSLRNASMTIDEVRDRRGQDPLPDGLGSRPMVYTGTGPVLLEEVIEAFDNPEPAMPAVIAPPSADDPPQPVEGQGGQPTKAAPEPAEKLAKAARHLISTNRPKARRARKAIKRSVAAVFASTADDAAAQVETALKALNKAADDAGAYTNAMLAAQLAAQVQLDGLDSLSDQIFDDLFEVTVDSAGLALAGVGVKAESDLFDQVNQRAVNYARTRAAQMVSIQGDKNIVAYTREAIRSVIAEGLDQNLGHAKIADAIQASVAFSADRAELIADSEIRMANAAGKTEGWQAAQSSGLTLQKAWQTSNDGDCCDECQDNEDAGLIALDEAFPSGAQDEGDSHPNCHCVTYVEVVEGDEAADAGTDDED